MRDPIVEFKAYNAPFARRNPELLRYKIARMAAGPFPFFRGTFHLFARDLLCTADNPLPLLTGGGAELELIGDIHSENFGTFRAEDGLIHYDTNDFDETTHARFGLDVFRLATSHFLASQDRPGETLERATQLTLSGLRAYVEAVRRLLKKAKSRDFDVNEKTPSGAPAVDALVRTMAAAKRPAFISKLTKWEGGRAQLNRTADSFNLSDAEREQAVRLVTDYKNHLSTADAKSGFYDVEDVCGHVSGIGSMGRLRYLVLIAGKGSADARNVLLEFKESLPSAYDMCRGREIDQAALAKRAERVVTVQKESQASSGLFVAWADDGGTSFQVRQRGPNDGRLAFAKLAANEIESTIGLQASILARVHARCAARAVGPTNPLAELEDGDVFCQRALAFALTYADLVRRDWKRFVGARAELEAVETWAKS